jgi:hypothetical protein
MAGGYTAVDEQDASAEVADAHATDELASMRQRHDELVRRLDSVSPRAPLRAEPGQNSAIDASYEAVSLDLQPEAEDMADERERSSLRSSTQDAVSPRQSRQRLMIAREAEEDTNAVVSPAHSDFLLTSIGAKVAAIPFMWACNIFVGVGLLVSLNTYSDEPKTWLTHVFDTCQPVGGGIVLIGSGIALGRVTAVGGHLVSLGAGQTKISERSYRGLRRSHALMIVMFMFFTMLGLLSFVTATRVGTQSKITGRVITEGYAVVVFISGLSFLAFSVAVWPMWLTLKMASVLVADAVSETKQKIERCTPASAEWELEVIPSVLGLCNETLPLLSEGWGDAVAALFLGSWLCSLGYFAAFLETGGTTTPALFLVICAVTPVAVTYDAASVSTDCNLLDDALTVRRMDGPKDDLVHAHAIRTVELILDRQNRRQGLGFTVAKILVDLRMLGTILLTLASFGTTVVPIMFALRPGAAGEESSAAGMDICSLNGTIDQSRACCAGKGVCVSALAFLIHSSFLIAPQCVSGTLCAQLTHQYIVLVLLLRYGCDGLNSTTAGRAASSHA